MNCSGTELKFTPSPDLWHGPALHITRLLYIFYLPENITPDILTLSLGGNQLANITCRAGMATPCKRSRLFSDAQLAANINFALNDDEVIKMAAVVPFTLRIQIRVEI
jgi:hypothetical protein